MPRTKLAWGSSTSLRIWRQLPSSSDHHPISLSPPIQILSWKIGGQKNELQNITKKLKFWGEKSVNLWKCCNNIPQNLPKSIACMLSIYWCIKDPNLSQRRFNIWHEKSNQHCICPNVFSFPNFKASDFGWEVDDECRDRFRTSDPSGVIW